MREIIKIKISKRIESEVYLLAIELIFPNIYISWKRKNKNESIATSYVRHL